MENTEKEKPNEKEDKATESKTTAIDEAKQILEKVSAVKAETEEMLGRAEALKSEQMLSGTSDAGHVPAEPDKEQAIKDRCNAMLDGTGHKI